MGIEFHVEAETKTHAICEGDIFAPKLRILRSTAFNHELARFYTNLDLSGDATVDWVLTQVFDHHRGKLFDHDGQLIEIETNPDLTDDIFRIDERRFINRHKARATKRFKYRLQMRVVFPIMMMHFAREIYFSRLSDSDSAT